MNRAKSIKAAKTPVVILSGGAGIQTCKGILPKSLMQIGRIPILLRVIDSYCKAGFCEFIVATGIQGKLINALFAGLGVKVRIGGSRKAALKYRLSRNGTRISVTVVDTGAASMTGERLLRVKPFLSGAKRFCMTYGDTISDLDPSKVLEFHLAHGRLATLTAVHMPVRFRILGLYGEDIHVRGFADRAILEHDSINGGYYVFERKVLSLPSVLGKVKFALENELLEELSERRELCAYRHDGVWNYFDSEQDCVRLAKYWESSEVRP